MSPSKIICYWEAAASAAGKVTITLALHRPCVTVVYLYCGLQDLDREMSTSPRLRMGIAAFTFTLLQSIQLHGQLLMCV